ncbi:glycosyl transferase [Xylanibacter ruminicola]|uniref:Glycosyltransferase, group 1 family n=2 Tax=Xylanibacter ruminicola TaxID=839 RepID=D5ESY7_XYLR2|nr:glycosyltransferase [Xylanibacter ruminicola]ADE83241.1 glycosyltransferase, group 1 family [Xylanibacter ruminicola 23]GJG33867.1 glycosyl transferase [Xylanibacter ruminicola]
MKSICFITDSIFKSGGMQRVTAVIAEELSKQYDVTIVSFEEPEQEDLSMYGLKDYPVKIVFTHFRKTEKWKSMLYNAYSYLYKNALPKTAITSDLYAHSSFPREMREAVVKILKEGDFDTIIAVNSYLSMRLATIKRDLGDVKAIGWIYNSFNAFLREGSPYLGTELKYHYGRQLQKLDETVLLYLQDSEMYYHAYGFSPFVIPNPLTLKPGAPSTGKNKRFLAVGRLTPKHKGFDLLIKAFDKFAQRNSDWYLDIVGDGPEKEALNKMIENRYLTKRIKIHPFTENIQMFYSQASIYVSSSRWKDFGLVLVQAMAHGLPVISSDLPSSKEILGDFGMYFKNGDVDDLAKRLEEATYMDWQLKSNEAIMISQRFNANVIAEQWKTLIESDGQRNRKS